MPSPFPGMDPYLEHFWSDVRPDLLALTRTALNDLMPVDLVARINSRLVDETTFVSILDKDSLITAIEFLSPIDKIPAEFNSKYRALRDRRLAAKVNVVEIDLVRQGSWRELLKPFVPPAETNSTYRAMVRRSQSVHHVELYPFSLRQQLPKIAIPLRDGDEDVLLDFQALVNQSYQNGRYGRTDYTVDTRPRLDQEDSAWADELLRKAGLR